MFQHRFHKIDRPFVATEHTEDGHYYRTDKGELYPSITTIFKLLDDKEWYPFWVQSVMRKEDMTEEEAEIECKRIGKESMRVGTILHKCAEDYLNNEEVIISQADSYETDVKQLFLKLKTWLDENIEEVYGTECKLYSDEMRLAGTVDLVAKLKTGEVVILDFKNSRKPKTPGKIKDSHYYIQMCAYAKMWEECMHEKITEGIVLVISWDGKVRPFKCKLEDHESDLMDWILKYEEYKTLYKV